MIFLYCKHFRYIHIFFPVELVTGIVFLRSHHTPPTIDPRPVLVVYATGIAKNQMKILGPRNLILLEAGRVTMDLSVDPPHRELMMNTIRMGSLKPLHASP